MAGRYRGPFAFSRGKENQDLRRPQGCPTEAVQSLIPCASGVIVALSRSRQVSGMVRGEWDGFRRMRNDVEEGGRGWTRCVAQDNLRGPQCSEVHSCDDVAIENAGGSQIRTLFQSPIVPAL